MSSQHPGSTEPLTGFAARHIGPSASAAEQMLSTLGYDSLQQLVDSAVPAGILQDQQLDPPSRSARPRRWMPCATTPPATRSRTR